MDSSQGKKIQQSSYSGSSLDLVRLAGLIGTAIYSFGESTTKGGKL